MSSIPLPALSIHNYAAQQQPDLGEQYGRILALKNMMALAPLQQQEAQQRIQEGQFQIQQDQQAIKDRQAFQSAMADPANQGKTMGEIADVLAHSNGISPQTWQALKKADVEQKTANANLTDIQLKAAKAAHDQTQELYNNVRNMSDEDVAKNWSSIAQQYDAIPGNTKMPLDPSQPLTKDQLKQFGPFLSMNNSYLDQELARREKEAGVIKAENEAAYGPTGPAAKAKYQFILQKAASGIPLSPDETSYAKAFEASEAKSTTQSDSLGVTSVSTNKPSGLASVTRGGKATAPSAGAPSSGGSGAPLPSSNLGSAVPSSPANIKANTVDLIGQYRMDPALLGRMLYKHPEMLGMINAKYPDWDQTSYQAKANMVKSYTSGPESRSINAIGTALGHANELRDAIEALGNGDTGLKTLRAIGNKYGIETGNDNITAFNTVVHRLAPEITAAYVQGGGGEGERVAAGEDFSPNLSRNQLIKNWSETVKLLQSKIAQDKQQWDTTYKPSRPQDDFYARFMSPVAKQAVDRWSSETGNSSAIGGSNTPSTGKVIRYKIVNGQLVAE